MNKKWLWLIVPVSIVIGAMIVLVWGALIFVGFTHP